jgi:aspartate/methionine/tyrosine aminotransferase
MNSNLRTFDLGFGDPVCVRDALSGLYTIPLDLIKLQDITYPDPVGSPELIKSIVSFGELAGNENVVLTTGANQAINVILRVMRREGKKTLSKNSPCFMYYDNIIDKSGFIREDTISLKTDVILYDSPSNPYGFVDNIFEGFNSNFIWDSVYHSPTYINAYGATPTGWRFRIGGFSKLIGLSGLRVGWIVCRDKNDVDAISNEIKYENCGISSVSQVIALDVMNKLDWSLFFRQSKMRINMNREEVNKIKRIFDNVECPVNGMFYPVTANEKSLKILNKAGVKYIILVEGKEPVIRLSLGQNNSLTRDAVKAILTADRIRSRK